MHFDAEQTINALGIAYSQAAGTHQVTRDSALTKRMQPGFAAKTALISVALTKAGIAGVRHTFEGEDGLFKSYLHGNYDPVRLREGLGQRFDLLGLSYKLYPCCGFAQVAIATARELRKKVAANKIKGLTAYVNRATNEIVGTPIEVRRAPQTTVQAQFSIPYTVACALINDTVTLKDFTEEGIRNPQVRELSARITVEIDEDIERERPGNMAPVRLVAETDEGVVQVRVDHPSGSIANPMTRADFDLKMAGCLEISGISWPSGQVQHLRHVIDGLENASRGSLLMECLAPPATPGATTRDLK
jgi:2-methylcitrate dehydratase PrpD